MIFLYDLRCKAEWRYGDGSARNLLKALVTDGTFAMAMYRLMQWSHRHRLAPLAMIFNKLGAFFGQCIIGRGADFGPGFVLLHSQGVVINGTVRGGERVYLEHQVTIGAQGQGSPQIGNRVYIGAGAKVLGGIIIGDNVKVGANAVVVRDVPADVSVGGIPARIISDSRRKPADATTTV